MNTKKHECKIPHLSNNEHCETITVRIYMGGDYNVARSVTKKYLFDHPGCVNMYKVDYIYTGGEEAGFCVEYINYPKFPKNAMTLILNAEELARLLMRELGERTCSIQHPDGTVRLKRKEYHDR